MRYNYASQDSEYLVRQDLLSPSRGGGWGAEGGAGSKDPGQLGLSGLGRALGQLRDEGRAIKGGESPGGRRSSAST